MKARRFAGAIVALMAIGGLAACGSDDKMDDGHNHKMHDGK
ncbi:Uncharacterised protein [Arcanobacterium haemolyticum]|nr:hypothetical protein [Arcanobacterium haemolyticum]SPT76003.1 Uncharacterised protein [Arcanobacterium haemolyticum]